MSLKRIGDLLLNDTPLTVVDAGAAGGLHPRWRWIADHLRSVGFEPLDEKSDDGRNLNLPFALGSSDRTEHLLVTNRISMTSLLPPAADLIARFWDKPEHTKVVETLEVELRRLDDLTHEHDFRPDMLKIDVQGAEQDILDGATGCLDDSVLAAEIELSFMERYTGLTRFQEVVAWMDARGFELIDLWRIKRYRHRNKAGVVNPGIAKGLRAGRLAFCDTLFMRRDADLCERVRSSSSQAAKLIALCLVYGKADMAARFHDMARDHFESETNAALDSYFAGISGRQFGRRGVHRALDYFSSKV